MNRREFLNGMTLAGTASLLSVRSEPAGAEPPLETTTIRLVRRMDGATCVSPQYVAGDLLRAEGFTDVTYVETTEGGVGVEKALASGQADLSIHYAASLAIRLDRGDPVVILAGAHVGCYELFTREGVRSVRDLKGLTIATPTRSPGATAHALMSIILKQVGIDPSRDVQWAVHPPAEQVRLFTEGRVDAFLAFPPASHELKARGIARVLLNSAVDRPWSQYFCCVIAGHREFVRKSPVATKRAVRALLRSADLCALERTAPPGAWSSGGS